ncbi:MAG: hypothetical protein KGL43_04005 [Burkholderiales bacterium]|nr:hypothetical protein [Burkholderiales bacterium]MDE2452734.1 hypothetical protein [Burkholderiales bacterium]
MAVLPWIVAMLILGVALWLVVMAHKVWPDADRGNCWSFATPRWYRGGGHLQIRWSEGVRVLGLRIPHVSWVPKLPPEGIAVEQSEPVKRERGDWLPPVFYFRFFVKRREMPPDEPPP